GQMAPHGLHRRIGHNRPPGRWQKDRGRRRAVAHGIWRRPARIGTRGPSFELMLARWPKSDGMIAAPVAAARNTSTAVWPATGPPRARGSLPPRRPPLRLPRRNMIRTYAMIATNS